MSKRKMNLMFVSLFIAFFICYVLYGLISKNNLDKNHKITVGMAYDCSSNGRGNGGRLNVEFRFILDGKEYKETTAFLTSELSEEDCRNYFLGKYFPVVYYPPNASNSLLLIEPKQFKRFGYLFPDSLQWTLNYIKR